ncbi:tyrosine-type recombinase/integrase, partial [Bacteroides fragilis]|nr:tyrosine-type recombinase/integrase [Bacteroides fragilis]
AEAIIRRHFRDGSPYVFPFLHHRKGRGSKGKDGGEEKAGSLPEESALRRVNRHAVEIGKLAGLSAPLTTYVLRHTWATLMLEAGYSVELIGQCLGHTSVTTTHIYLSRISSGQVDTAVDEMFNRLV